MSASIRAWPEESLDPVGGRPGLPHFGQRGRHGDFLAKGTLPGGGLGARRFGRYPLERTLDNQSLRAVFVLLVGLREVVVVVGKAERFAILRDRIVGVFRPSQGQTVLYGLHRSRDQAAAG